LAGYRTKQELAYEALRDAIITCRFPPGKRLVENELAQQLGMSRSPIREALKRLSSEGLVKEVPHIGVTVADVALDSLHELYLVLAALEGLACREATLRRSEETLQSMAQLLEAMDRMLARDDYLEWARLNAEFHFLSRRDCAMPYLLHLLNEIWNRLRRFQIFSGAAALRAPQSQKEHRAIYEAMQAGDADRVEFLSRVHNAETDRSFAEYLRSLPEAAS